MGTILNSAALHILLVTDRAGTKPMSCFPWILWYTSLLKAVACAPDQNGLSSSDQSAVCSGLEMLSLGPHLSGWWLRELTYSSLAYYLLNLISQLYFA